MGIGQKSFFIQAIVFCVALSHNGLAQNWINSAGGNFNDESYDVEVDAPGNIYTTGYVTAASVFGPTIDLTTAGYSDIYVSKSTPNGNFVWAKVFGGELADRGYDLTLDASGNIYVTGYFQGTADFGGTTLTSNGTQDVFVLKLNNAGDVQWVRAEGGPDGDTGYGITVDGSGNTIVTGQFQGTASIGPNTFSSVIDPYTNEPSYDMFVAKYDMDGNDLWSIQGLAKYDDRGLALETDPDRNIYVTGQFSDTLTIAGNTHDNTIFNAGMVLKLDPAGNHIWFRKLGAVQTLVRDIELDPSGNALMTGDFIGQMLLADNSGINLLNGNYQYGLFVIKLTTDGDVMWMSADASDSQVSAKAIALDASGAAYISGTFKCVFDDYADELGPGLFNSVGFNDVFIAKFNQNGTRQWMRQYGGPLDDFCSGIAISTANEPIVSGGYTEYFNYPYNNDFLTFPYINTGFEPYSWSPGCSTNGYSSLDAIGAKDIFIGKPVNLSFDHYYYYENISCFQVNTPCIQGNCPDSLVFCSGGQLYYDTHTAGNGQHDDAFNTSLNDHHGPYFDFLWNTGNTGSTIGINTTGDYWASTERIDGCKSYSDTVFAQVNPIPEMPLLSDDHEINVLSSPYNSFGFCYPDSLTLWFNGLDTTLQFSYTTPSGQTITDTLPHQFFEPGSFLVTVVDSNGCANGDPFQLEFDNPIWDTIVPYLLQLKDTICIYEAVPIIVADSLAVPLSDSAFCSPAIFNEQWNIATDLDDTCLIGWLSPDTTGWYTVSVLFALGYNNLCGLDSVQYHITDSFYVVVMPAPELELELGGDSLLCPGDVVNVWTDTVVNGFSWSTYDGNILIVNSTSDSIFANQQGTYSYGGYIVSDYGCIGYAEDDFMVVVKPSPSIFSNVPDNIICPGDSLLLTCPVPALSYDWIGPGGNSLGSDPTLWVSVPGFYHVVIVDPDNCTLTSNTIELIEYNTPYLMVSPGTELCLTGSVMLTSVYNGAPDLWWPAPVSSSANPITVTQPGVYYMEVTQCGITVVDSVEVTLTEVLAEITPLTDTLICLGQTASLSANSVSGSYDWSPGGWPGQVLNTQEEGSYQVTVTDAGTGCSATSNSITVSYRPGSLPPDVNNATVCAGDTAVLTNLNMGVSTAWFTDPFNIDAFFNGETLLLSGMTGDTIIYVENSDDYCTSERIPVIVSVTFNDHPSIMGDTMLCIGQTLLLNTDSLSEATYQWLDPSGTLVGTSAQYVAASMTLADTGYYQLVVSNVVCYTGQSGVFVTVNPPPPGATIFGDTVYCVNDTLILFSDSLNVEWADPQQNTFVQDTLSIVGLTLSDAGMYLLMNLSDGCASEPDTVHITVQDRPAMADIYGAGPYCEGDDVELSVDSVSGVNYLWSGPNTFSSTASVNWLLGVGLQQAGVYNLTLENQYGCRSMDSAIVQVFFYPQFEIGNDTVICVDSLDNFMLEVSPDFSEYIWQDGSSLNYFDVQDTGLFHLTIVEGGVCATSDSIYVSSSLCLPNSYNVFSPNGNGYNETFVIENLEYYPGSRIEVYNRWGLLIYQSDDYRNDWDGSNYSDGTYYYIVYPNDPEKKVRVLTGYVTLIR